MTIRHETTSNTSTENHGHVQLDADTDEVDCASRGRGGRWGLPRWCLRGCTECLGCTVRMVSIIEQQQRSTYQGHGPLCRISEFLYRGTIVDQLKFSEIKYPKPSNVFIHVLYLCDMVTNTCRGSPLSVEFE